MTKEGIEKERTVSYSEMVQSNGECGFVKEWQNQSQSGFRAISKNRSAIGMIRKVFKKKGT